MARAMIEGWNADEKGRKHEFFLFDRLDSGLKEYVSALAKSAKDEKRFHIFDEGQKMTDKDFTHLFGDENKLKSEIDGFVFLAVKPDDLEAAISQHGKLISRCIKNNFPIVSVMAGVKLEKIRQTIFKNFEGRKSSYYPASSASSHSATFAGNNQEDVSLYPAYWPVIRKDISGLSKGLKISYLDIADESSFNPPIIRLMPNLTAKYGVASGAYCSNDNLAKEKIVLTSGESRAKKVSFAFLQALLDELDKESSYSKSASGDVSAGGAGKDSGAVFTSQVEQYIGELNGIIHKNFFDDWKEGLRKEDLNNKKNSNKKNAFRTFLADKIFLPIRDHHEELLQHLFKEFSALVQPLGHFQKVAEDKMDVVTALAGSGPAFVAVFAEALSDAGVCQGLSRKDAIKMSLQILQGTACYIDREKMHPAAFKDAVASPGGTTIEGLKALEDKGFRSAVLEAVASAFKRARNLSREKKYKSFFPAKRGS